MSVETLDTSVADAEVGAAPRNDLWTKDDVAQYFRISAAGISNWQARGWLPKPLRVGRKPLWRRSDILALVERPATAAK